MSSKRSTDASFEPFADSAKEESHDPRASERGREIKIGLAVLAVVLLAAGYVVVTQVFSGGESSTETAHSDPSVAGEAASDDVDVLGSAVVPAHFPAIVRPEPASDAHSLVKAQWNGVSSVTETSSREMAPPHPMTAMPMGYGQAGDMEANADWEAAERLPEGSFGPAGSAPSYAGAFPMPPTGGGASAYGPGEGRPETSALDYPPQASMAWANSQIPSPASSSGSNTGDWQTPPLASNSGYSPPAAYPGADLYGPASGYAAPRPFDSGPTVPAEEPYGTRGALSYDPRPEPRASFSASSQKTPAEYAGVSGNGGMSGAHGAMESWQQPTVVATDGKYTARPNDNFYTISKKIYGSGAYFQALAQHNREKYPQSDRIRIGDIVLTPPVEQLEARYPALCPKPDHRNAAKSRTVAAAAQPLAGRRVYVVQNGDTLFDIARYELGSRSRVAEVIEMNRELLGDQINYLTPGMRLLLPDEGDRAPVVTQRAEEAARR